MDYQKIYNDLIENAKSKNRKKYKGQYYERHHIVPKCIGGLDNKENLILLTAREHFVAHKLLVEIYPNNNSLIYSYNYMSVMSNCHERDYKISNREYKWLREKLSSIMSNRIVSVQTKEKISKSRCNITVSQETKDKIRKTLTGRKLPESVKINMSNKIISDSFRSKISKIHKGKIVSEESKKKMSDSWKNREQLICPHCGKKSAMKANMYRLHLDNCKFKKEEVAA